MKNFNTIGVDVGGSHITAGLVDLTSRKILQQSVVRQHLNSQGSLEEILTIWTDVIKQTAKYGGVERIRLGIAIPGPFDYDEGVSMIIAQNKYGSFFGLNVKELLSVRLGISKNDILMMNDASCFLQGEVFGGAGMNYSKVIGLTLGTGLGSAKSSSAQTADCDLWCQPFLNSIAEDYLSTRWFIKRYKELSSREIGGVKELSCIVDSDASAMRTFKEFGSNLGLFLVNFIETEKPEIVVLGGNISNAANFFLPETLSVLNQHNINIPVVQAILGEDASLIGAASLWANSREFV